MNEANYYNTKEFFKKVLEHYKNVHKHWKDRKWIIESSTIFNGEKSHTFNYKDLPYNDYTKFQIGEDGKMTRIHVFENIYDYNGEKLISTHEEKETCYDDVVAIDYKLWFEFSYPYIKEIIRDKDDVKIIETKYKIIEENEYSR